LDWHRVGGSLAFGVDHSDLDPIDSDAGEAFAPLGQLAQLVDQHLGRRGVLPSPGCGQVLIDPLVGL